MLHTQRDVDNDHNEWKKLTGGVEGLTAYEKWLQVRRALLYNSCHIVRPSTQEKTDSSTFTRNFTATLLAVKFRVTVCSEKLACQLQSRLWYRLTQPCLREAQAASNKKSLFFPSSSWSSSILLLSECTLEGNSPGNGVWWAHWRRHTSAAACFPFRQRTTCATLTKQSNKTAEGTRNVWEATPQEFSPWYS